MKISKVWGRRNEKCHYKDTTSWIMLVMCHKREGDIIVYSNNKIWYYSQGTRGQAGVKSQILTLGENSRKIQPDPNIYTIISTFVLILSCKAYFFPQFNTQLTISYCYILLARLTTGQKEVKGQKSLCPVHVPAEWTDGHTQIIKYNN